jgi:hypothetical protein
MAIRTKERIMHRSIEEGFIVSMVEGDEERAAERLSPKWMKDGELIEFYETISRSLDLINLEIEARGLSGRTI